MSHEAEIKAYWQTFVKEQQLNGAVYSAWTFGSTPEMANELADLTFRGIKTATTSAYDLYEEDEAYPQVGEYNMILDGHGHPVCITKTLAVEVVPYKNVTAEHAYYEGEGDRTLAYWRKVHEAFFKQEYKEAGKTFSEDMNCLCELFEVVG
ncbi:MULTISPECIES: ASCH domain-containing protein [Pediococcus]|uniref:ASCH domain-containing protein n=1 Tax=Pediococcus parvulus TaxID=54062 RepID=A0A176TLM8_9LACO|nr:MULTISPECIES: ASCH domain-containing protein [Pediococcus]MCT3026886.1 ASCH domain-containing protein [Pediococcus parvulus]MCT3028168.1 ASCH domain-containing protein [Pediococcus parvulus]MCT3030168.1 ASCH domain-containing protein [Pediococcus parvulus]MCT3035433.1 ASCH domain-containing protein [Pediococcus parvulus]MDN5575181.1 ASCH domain-containing protein [Pediococcus sp.]